MTVRAEFHFDFGSPNAYLSHLVLPAIEQRTGVCFEYVPVLLGGVWEPTIDGPPVWRPQNDAELQAIRNLVRSAVGFDEQRGDKITVESLPMQGTPGTAASDVAPGVADLLLGQLHYLAQALALVLIAFVGGLSLIVACANVLYRDIEHLVATILLPWFFLTPVFYTFESIPAVSEHETLVDVLQYANPVTPILTAIRDPLFFGQLPSWGDVVYSVVAAALSLGLGALVFHRIDDRLAVEL